MHVKTLRLLKKTAEHQDCPVFTVFFFNYKNFIPKYLDYALTDAANKLHEHLGSYFWEIALVNDFGRTVPSAEKYCCK